MNYKLNSYLSILAITCAVAVPLLSANAHELPVQAALTAPASYHLNYQYNSGVGGFTLGTTTLGTYYVGYTRTTDSTYYNYTTTITHDSHADSVLPEGLDITMTFNRSNTNWYFGSLYYPEDTKIGSNSTVGTIEKGTLIIHNQTNKNYLIHIDMSSNTSNVFTRLFYDDYRFNNGNDNTLTFFRTTINRLYIPSFTKFELRHYSASTAYYLDAWYLQDLGVSDSYDAGYEVGEDDGYEDGLANNPNILINATESLIGMFVNFTFILFSLELFGVSILTVVGVLFGIIAIVWILKTIRG